MCNISHSISRVFLAWFPEEMRPTAAACPPLPNTQLGLKEERGSGSRAGDTCPSWKARARPLPILPSWPPALGTPLTSQPGGCAGSCQTWEAFGKREGEVLQGGGGGAQFYRMRIAFALKPSYTNRCGLNCRMCSTRCTLPMVRPFLQLLALPHPEVSVYSQPADICTGSGSRDTRPKTTFTQTQCYQDL